MANEFTHTQPFDRTLVSREYKKVFRRDPPPPFFDLLAMMERDPLITDVRWMAYMLATTATESGRTFQPIDEKGKGNLGTLRLRDQTGEVRFEISRKKRYYLPVKVSRLPDGTAQIVEQDGDVFIVRSDGSRFTQGGKRVPPHQVRRLVGAAAGFDPNPMTNYLADAGIERRYYGRGFVQITWWYNYALAGYELGRNLDFLFDPELLKEPTIAYRIMSLGMRTGKIFASGLTFRRFINGNKADYLHARQMVNGLSGAQHIAEDAVKFENILLASKKPSVASTGP